MTTRSITITVDDDDPTLDSVTVTQTGVWPNDFEPSLFSLIGKNGDVEILNSGHWGVEEVRDTLTALALAVNGTDDAVITHTEEN
jgi:hypothetical protein